MIATHLMWKEACPTNFIYVFPTRVSDTCCVLTMGRQKLLSRAQELAAARFARALFIHPLLLDHRKYEEDYQEIRYLETYARPLGHNFPKVLITPGLAQLWKVRRGLEALTSNVQSRHNVEDVRGRIKILIEMFEHSETLLTATLKSESPYNAFVRPCDEEGVTLEEVLKPVKVIEQLYREKTIVVSREKEVAEQLSVKCDYGDLKNLSMLCHKEFLKEAVINVVTNALDLTESRYLKKETRCLGDASDLVDRKEPRREKRPPPVTVQVGLDKDKKGREVILVTVKDRAGGFPDDKLKEVRARIAQVENIKKEEKEKFNDVVSKLVPRAVSKSAEGTLSLGLLFCAAYLRSLEWVEQINRAGCVRIENRPTEHGSCIELCVPLVRRKLRADRVLETRTPKPDQLSKHVGFLRELKERRERLTLRVLVAENHLDTFLLLDAFLMDFCALTLAVEDRNGCVRSCMKLSTSRVLEEFRAANYDAVVVDLALSPEQERVADRGVATPGLLRHLYLESTHRTLMDHLHGLVVLRLIRQECPRVPMRILSNYVSHPQFLRHMIDAIGMEIFESIQVFTKDPEGRRQMRDWLHRLCGEN